MDSKMKELSAEEMDLVTGGLEKPHPFEVNLKGELVSSNQKDQFNTQNDNK